MAYSDSARPNQSGHSDQPDNSKQPDNSNPASQPSQSKKNTDIAKKLTSQDSHESDGNNGEHDFVLSKQEAEAASPDDMAVCGEEDPGEGLEFLVENENKDK